MPGNGTAACIGVTFQCIHWDEAWKPPATGIQPFPWTSPRQKAPCSWQGYGMGTEMTQEKEKPAVLKFANNCDPAGFLWL